MQGCLQWAGALGRIKAFDKLKVVALSFDHVFQKEHGKGRMSMICKTHKLVGVGKETAGGVSTGPGTEMSAELGLRGAWRGRIPTKGID